MPVPLRNPPACPATSDLFNPIPRGYCWVVHTWEGNYCTMKKGTCPACMGLLADDVIADLRSGDQERNRRGLEVFYKERTRLINDLYGKG